MNDQNRIDFAEALLERNASTGQLPVRKLIELLETTGREAHTVEVNGVKYNVTKEA